MKKFLNLCLLTLGILLLESCNTMSGNDLESLLKAADLKLTDYTVTYSNMERKYSAWDDYTYHLQLPVPVNAELISQLENLAKTSQDWKYIETENGYEYEKRKEDHYALLIVVNIDNGTVVVNYVEYNFLF